MKLIFAWYDFYVGIYIARESGLLYIFPIPMVGVVIRYKKPTVTTININIPPPNQNEIETIIDKVLNK